MYTQREYEIVQHTNMHLLEVFVIEILSRNPHGHSDLELGLVLKGHPVLYIEGSPRGLKPDDIYIINRYQIHSFSSADSNQILIFQISAEIYRHLAYKYKFLHFNENLLTPYMKKDLLLRCAGAYYDDAPYHELQCFELLTGILYQILTHAPCSIDSEQASVSAKENSVRLERILDYLAEHYAEDVSLQDIAELEGISTWHVSHFMKEMIGISFQEYLSSLRFEHALELIRDTRLSIQDICMETGFSSSRYLNQAFEKHFQCTAREYRALQQKPPLISSALPTGNVETRYSFERSSAVLERCSKESLLQS